MCRIVDLRIPTDKRDNLSVFAMHSIEMETLADYSSTKMICQL